MDSLIWIAALLLHWRASGTVAVATAFAVALATYVPWFTGAHGLALVLVAFGAGLLWEGSAHASTMQPRSSSEGKLSTPVAALGLAFFGAVAGGLASSISGSFAVGATVLVCGAAFVRIYESHASGTPFAWRSLAFSVCCLLFGVGCLAALGELQHV